MLEKILWNEEKEAFVKCCDGNEVSASAIGDPVCLEYDDGYWDFEDNKKEVMEKEIIEYVKNQALKRVNAYSASIAEPVCTSTVYSIQLFHID